MPIEVDDRERDTILAALRYWQREGLHSAGMEHEIAENGREGDDAALLADEIDDLCERINFDLPDDKMRELAWKLFDNLGIQVIVAIDADDILEDREELGLPEISRAEVIEALGEVAQLDWSDFNRAARVAVEAKLEKVRG
jgi:hypothetical protein